MAANPTDGPHAGSDPDDPGRREHAAAFGRPEPLDWKRWIKPGLWGIIALYTLIFVLMNSGEDDTVTVSFVFFQVTSKLFWALLLAMALGAALALGARWWWRVRDRGNTPARPLDKES